MRFWRDFRTECPDIPVRTRGTNLTTGIDLGSDASPIAAIYRDAGPIDAPVNSPWAALDGDVGLELAGWMSHIAQLPHPGYRFRYYIHDPWWLNSPWLDRYQRQPFDIFLPLSVSRLLGDGKVDPPSDLAFLSIDDSHGRMPINVPIEVTSHILHAREFQPDASGPIVWIYPFTEYTDIVLGDDPDPSLPFFGDWFVRGLIAHGVPVNQVANAEDISSLIETNAKVLSGSILIAPVLPDRYKVTDLLIKYAQAGGNVLFYGPLDRSPALRDLLEIELKQPLSGDFEYVCGNDHRVIRHLPFLSGGDWHETSQSKNYSSHIQALQKGESRTVAVSQKIGNGKIAWIRGCLATAEFDPERPAPIKGPRLQELDASKFISTEEIARDLLGEFGMTIEWAREISTNASPLIAIHRNQNAFVFFRCPAPIGGGPSDRFTNGRTFISGASESSRKWHNPVFRATFLASRVPRLCRGIG